MRFSDISGYRTTAKYSDLYRSARDYEQINFPVYVSESVVKPVKSLLACSLSAGHKKDFCMTYRKNGYFKRTLSQSLNIYTLDAITFRNMVKLTGSTKHETLLSLHKCKKQKESLDQDKIQLESNFEKCATTHVKMNYRLSVFFVVRAF